MKATILTTTLLLISTLLVHGQQIRAAYYGETITHYGLKVSYERPIYSYMKASNSIRKEFLFVPGLAIYRHPANHIGVIISPELAYRRTGKRGGQFEVAISPGYFRYFLEGSTFEAGQDGKFRQVPMAGGNAFLPTISVGWGNDMSVRHQIPLSWYTRLNLMQQRPYNATALMRFGIECGIIFPIKKS